MIQAGLNAPAFLLLSLSSLNPQFNPKMAPPAHRTADQEKPLREPMPG